MKTLKAKKELNGTMNTSKLKKMKTMKINLITLLGAAAFALFNITATAQVGGWNPELVEDSKAALETMMDQTPKLQTFYDKAYAYAVFPKITKGGIGVGGAMGNGVVYQDKVLVASSKLRQATFGIQFGGQQYSEVIFFENEKTFEKFMNGKLKFDAQASAVALKEGVSIDAAYANGVAVFTRTKGGLMYEASIGGQHFSNKPITKD